MISGKKRIKIVERCGDILIDTLSKADPWDDNDGFCRQDCLVCIYIEDDEIEMDSNDIRTDGSKRKIGRCGLESVSHTCEKAGKKAIYYGETSRTAYLRGLDHLEGRTQKREDIPLYKHDMVSHPDRKQGEDYFL